MTITRRHVLAGAIAAVAAGFVPDSRRQSRALPAHRYTRRADRLRAQIDHAPQKCG